MYFKLHKTSLNCAGSYIDSPEGLTNKKATINPRNNDDVCFQYSIAAALNLEQMESSPERMTNVKPFINQYNWKEM